jgi:hypothetical protein
MSTRQNIANITAAATLLSMVTFNIFNSSDGDHGDRDAADSQVRSLSDVQLVSDAYKQSGERGASASEDRQQDGLGKVVDETLRFFGKTLEGKRVRGHADGDPVAYLRDMLIDKVAREFLVPDDHVDGVRREIQRNISESERSGDDDAVSMWIDQLKKLKPLGKDFKVLEMVASGSAANAWRMSRVPRHGKGAALYVAAIDGGMVVYRAMSGKITPKQAKIQGAEVGVKAMAVGGATSVAVMLGSNPAGVTVMVVGGVTYVVIDYAISKVRPRYYSKPLSVDEIHAMMPTGWHWDDPMKNMNTELNPQMGNRANYGLAGKTGNPNLSMR